MLNGDRVKISRDEQLYPSKGSWPQFRGKVGTIVEINQDTRRPHLTEYGVVFGKVSNRSDGRGTFNHGGPTWFKAHELFRVASVRPAESFAEVFRMAEAA